MASACDKTIYREINYEKLEKYEKRLLSFINVNSIIAILYYSQARCYHWWWEGGGELCNRYTESLCNFLQLHMNSLKTKKLN